MILSAGENRTMLSSLEEQSGIPNGLLQGISAFKTGWRSQNNLLPDYMLPDGQKGANKTEKEVIAQGMVGAKALSDGLKLFNGNSALATHAYLNGVEATEKAIANGFDQKDIDDLYSVLTETTNIQGSQLTDEQKQGFAQTIGTPSQKAQNRKASTVPKTKQQTTQKMAIGGSTQAMVYNAWRNAGLSDNQAKIITAEVGRENDYQSKYLFGGHNDPANNKYNLGMLSWQKDRGRKLYNYLNDRGFIHNGKIVQSQEALNAQAQFAVNEMKTSYSKTARKFLANPNISYKDGAKVLGTDYIRWRYNDPKYSNHHARRDRYYQKAQELTGTQPQQAKPQQSVQRQTTQPVQQPLTPLQAQSQYQQQPQVTAQAQPSSQPALVKDTTMPNPKIATLQMSSGQSIDGLVKSIFGSTQKKSVVPTIVRSAIKGTIKGVI